MTINQCADQFALMLLQAERIRSVTYLAERGAVAPAIAKAARRTRVNHGLAEEVLAHKPDLIVAGSVTSPATRRLAKMMGVRIIELPPAESFDDIRRQTLMLGEAFGEQVKARSLVARMDATLAELGRTAPRRRISAISWNGVGQAPGGPSLTNAIVEAAGGYNPAPQGARSEYKVDLEQLLSLDPPADVLLYGVAPGPEAGRRVDLVEHPALLRAYGPRRVRVRRRPMPAARLTRPTPRYRFERRCSWPLPRHPTSDEGSDRRRARLRLRRHWRVAVSDDWERFHEPPAGAAGAFHPG